jgi:hypothetical protein
MQRVTDEGHVNGHHTCTGYLARITQCANERMGRAPGVASIYFDCRFRYVRTHPFEQALTN